MFYRDGGIEGDVLAVIQYERSMQPGKVYKPGHGEQHENQCQMDPMPLHLIEFATWRDGSRVCA
jgi:hypothetical protein